MARIKLPRSAGRGIMKKAADKLKFVDDPFDTSGLLKPNVRYRTGKPGTGTSYRYTTDAKGRITSAQARPLKLDNSGRARHNPDTPGKRDGDHAGHVFGDRFGGSPELDNLVSQARRVNLSEFKKIENNWARLLDRKPPATIDVDIRIDYGSGPRPTSFTIIETIDGNIITHKIRN